MRLLTIVAAAAVLLRFGSVAQAHVGATVAVVKFTNPADPPITHVDPNDTLGPFSVVTVDTSLTITWTDGDSDPTGRFTFYYVDHEPTFQVNVDDLVNTLATRLDDLINNTGGYYASCVCQMDAGVVCPTDPRDPAGNCANQIVWNTTTVPTGTYWLVAVNNDPPFHVFNVSLAPVRVVHGGQKPAPVVMVMRPDGTGAWDQSYHVQWFAQGKPPLTFDVSYGLEGDGAPSLQPAAVLATGISPPMNPDGTFTYDFDISQLSNKSAYWVRVKVTDGDGASTYTDSYFGITVFHNGGMVTTPDLAMTAPVKHSGCDVESADASSRSSTASLLLALAAVALALYLLRRATRG